MNSPERIAYQEAQNLVQSLNRNMVALATLLEKRLTPMEKQILANIFEDQVDLQLLLDKVEQRDCSNPATKKMDGSDFLANKLAEVVIKSEISPAHAEKILFLNNKVN